MTARERLIAVLGDPNRCVCGDCEDEAPPLLDAFAAEERAAAYREAADLIADNATCGCSTCRDRRDIAAVLRARADEIHPTADEVTP